MNDTQDKYAQYLAMLTEWLPERVIARNMGEAWACFCNELRAEETARLIVQREMHLGIASDYILTERIGTPEIESALLAINAADKMNFNQAKP